MTSQRKKTVVDKEELVASLFVALAGYTKEAFLQGYDTALLNKQNNGTPEQLFSESSIKQKINSLIKNHAPVEIPIPEDYIPCPHCLRLIHVTDKCNCKTGI